MGSVKLSGLNDYLSPSPECVLPIAKSKKSFEVTLRTDVKATDNRPVKVTLSDCLSCSGCLTSSVPMLENDFYKQVYNNLISSKCPVVSISTQSLLAISAKYGLKLTETFIKIKKFFISRGIKYVFNQSVAEAVQLQESKKEFQRSYKANSTLICSNCPGWVIYAEKSLDDDFLSHMSKIMPLQAIQGLLVKFIVTIRSKIELTKANYLGIFNPLLQIISDIREIGPNDIYHLCITPCHDKKLELLRPDLVANYTGLCELLQINSDSKTPLIDGVITTNELVQLIGGDFDNILHSQDDSYGHSDLLTHSDLVSIKLLLGIECNNINQTTNEKFFDEKASNERKAINERKAFNEIKAINERKASNEIKATNEKASSERRKEAISPYENTEFAHSGGYAEEMLKYVSKVEGERKMGSVGFKTVFNRDYKQAVVGKNAILKDQGQIRVTLATGFRNIANVVTSVKSYSGFSYIELMACPGGCINGGGQIKNVATETSYDDRKYIASEKVPAIIELEKWLWVEISKLVDRDKDLLTMELKSIKNNRVDW